ncbi:MAG: radical SAM protein, partial [Lentisphaeria bacterium]|nr:radical SAM protein [Lentisphaeria bacterium]
MLKKRPFTEHYIHVPFCRGKCDYCAFYSEGKMTEKDLSLYLEKLFSQMEEFAFLCGKLRTVYLGGGTPTLLPPEKMELLFRKIRENFLLEEDAEISMECNPETLTEEKCSVMKTFVNRVSMGVQSFSPLFRERIGRRTHGNETNRSFEETLSEAVLLLKKHGIKNIGFDLIYLLPGETLSDWEKELKKALSFGITHLSCYS